MKKKIITLCLVIALLSVAVIGGTLAYFTDVDRATNEFTVGGVSIDLWEEVNHVDGAGKEKDSDKNNDTKIVDGEEVPIFTLGKGTDEYQEYKYNAVMPGDVLTKVVTVENTNTEDAYIALAIKQPNYGPNWTPSGTDEDKNGVYDWYQTNDWNVRIDEYYEGGIPEDAVKTMKQEGRGFTPYTPDKMQKLVSDIFSGSGWNNLSYTKLVDGVAKEEGALTPISNTRYYPTTAGAVDQKGEQRYVGGDEAVLIAVDYAVAHQSAIHNGNMLGKDVYNKMNLNERIWVYYIYLPGCELDENGEPVEGTVSSYTLDLTLTVPGLDIDEYSIKAFEGMTLDVRASAIQASGFASAKEAFEALEKVYPYTYEDAVR